MLIAWALRLASASRSVFQASSNPSRATSEPKPRSRGCSARTVSVLCHDGSGVKFTLPVSAVWMSVYRKLCSMVSSPPVPRFRRRPSDASTTSRSSRAGVNWLEETCSLSLRLHDESAKNTQSKAASARTTPASATTGSSRENCNA
ncbi:MAG: hypothetical protein KatS3mg103_1028 [Phycisphaerales bacterium]|nr:MAG: hypothetical protein KatS3mg103_1028 [Phycisphaerales bacterium]